MKLSAILEPLVAAGVDAATILAAVKAWEEQQSDALEKRRQADAERQARKRERDTASRDITLRHRDRSLTGDRVTRVEDKSQTTEIEPQEENKPARGDAGEFRDALRAVLDPERIEALVKHRRSRKAPVTAYAAKLFLRDVEVCGISVAEAADHCISRNWLTVKPDWLAKVTPQARGSPPSRSAPSMADVFEFAARTRPDERPAEDFRGARTALPHLSVAGEG